MESAEKIYKAMIQPVFTYCGTTLGLCWSRSRKSQIESIERRSQKVIGGNYLSPDSGEFNKETVLPACVCLSSGNRLYPF